MTIYEITKLIIDNLTLPKSLLLILIVTYLIDVSKLKLDPWKWVAGLLKKAIKSISSVANADINERIDNLALSYSTSLTTHSDELSKLYDKLDEIKNTTESLECKLNNHIAESLRAEIIDYQNACINKRKHTREEWRYMYGVCDKYELYIADNHLKNSEVEDAIAYIRHVYMHCLESDEFLIEANIHKIKKDNNE